MHAVPASGGGRSNRIVIQHVSLWLGLYKGLLCRLFPFSFGERFHNNCIKTTYNTIQWTCCCILLLNWRRSLSGRILQDWEELQRILGCKYK